MVKSRKTQHQHPAQRKLMALQTPPGFNRIWIISLAFGQQPGWDMDPRDAQVCSCCTRVCSWLPHSEMTMPSSCSCNHASAHNSDPLCLTDRFKQLCFPDKNHIIYCISAMLAIDVCKGGYFSQEVNYYQEEPIKHVVDRNIYFPFPYSFLLLQA